ncbi:hypothetical protein AAHE18_09G089600 [Arachis hypogaea]
MEHYSETRRGKITLAEEQKTGIAAAPVTLTHKDRTDGNFKGDEIANPKKQKWNFGVAAATLVAQSSKNTTPAHFQRWRAPPTATVTGTAAANVSATSFSLFHSSFSLPAPFDDGSFNAGETRRWHDPVDNDSL